MFFTDGQGSWSNQRLQQLNKLFKEQQQSKNVTVTIYSIGFSSYHDAELLNKLAKTGSNIGNFVYIDTNQADYPQ